MARIQKTVQLAFALVLSACTLASEPQSPVREVLADPVVSYLLPGQTAQIRVQLADAAGKTREATNAVFLSADASIATVSPAGIITAKAPGKTNIAARVDSLSTTVSVEVLSDFGQAVASVYTARTS